MKVFKAESYPGTDKISAGLAVTESPYPHVRVGGQHQERRIPLGRRDAPFLPRPLLEAGVIKLEGKVPALIVAPRRGDENNALVLWHVSARYRGTVDLLECQQAAVIAECYPWLGNDGHEYQILAALAPGGQVVVRRTGRSAGRRVIEYGILAWDGQDVRITWSDVAPGELEAAEAEAAAS